MNLAKLIRRVSLVLGALVLAVAFLAVISNRPVYDSGGALSVKPEGRRAALQILQERGWSVTPWRQAPSLLAEAHALLLVGESAEQFRRGVFRSDEVADDDEAETLDDEVDDEREASDSDVTTVSGTTTNSVIDPRSGQHYLSFLESGGRALVDVRARNWLESSVGLELGDDYYADPSPFLKLSTPAGELFKVDLASTLALPQCIGGQQGTPLIRDTGGAPFAALYPVGKGAVVLVGDSDIWRNKHIAKDDHAYLLLALVGMLGGERTVLIDDFARGTHSPPGFNSFAFRGRMAPLSWTVVLWIVLAVTRSAWAWRFPRDPRAKDLVHPFLRVRAGARLLHRARGPVGIAKRLRAGFLSQLARKLRLTRSSESVVLEAALGRADGPVTSERWREALDGRLPSKQSPLEEWARELNEIERAVETSLRRETHSGAGRMSRTKHG